MQENEYLFGFGDFETCYNLSQIKALGEKEKIRMSDYESVESRVYLNGYTFGFDFEECKRNFYQSDNINDFYVFMKKYLNKEFKEKKHRKMMFYFHNLNFDISFMLDDLISLYTEYDIKILGSFSKIVQFSLKNKETGNTFILLDSLNILRVKLAQLPNLNGVMKRKDLLKVDMKILRDIDHVATEDEKEYHKYDILALASNVINHFSDKKMHITNSSYAYRIFIAEVKKRGLDKYFKLDRHGYTQNYNITRLNGYNFKRLVGRILNEKENVENLETYYLGSQTFGNYVYWAKLLENLIIIDNNGLYAHSYQNCKIPYITNINSKIKSSYTRLDLRKDIQFKKPHEVYAWIAKEEGLEKDDVTENYFTAFKMIMDIELKDDLTFSPITRGSCDNVIHIDEFIDDKVRTIKKARVVFRGSEYDLHNWERYYNINNVRLIEYYIFDIMKGNDLKKFRDIIGIWIQNKELHANDDNLLTYRSIKQLIVSVTGKFGEKMGKKELKIVDGKLVEFENEDIKTRLLPVIISITSFARTFMSSFIVKEKDNFVYSDTDSIHLANITLEELYGKYKIDQSKTGLFKIERIYEKALYGKAKHYVGLVDGKLKFTCAGCDVDYDLIKEKGITIESLMKKDTLIGYKSQKIPCHKGAFIQNSPFYFSKKAGISNELQKIRRINDEQFIDRYLFMNRLKNYDELIKKLDLAKDKKEYDNDFVITGNKDSMYDSILKER